MSSQPITNVAPSATTPSEAANGTEEVAASSTPELVVALCGPIGSPLHAAAAQIANALREFNYLTETIVLSDLIRLNAEFVKVVIAQPYGIEQTKALIEAGDALRRKYGTDVLAKLAIAKISADRRKAYGDFIDDAFEAETPLQKKIKNQRICHILDSIKNKAELELCRAIYGDAFFSVGIFSPLEVRRTNLQRIWGFGNPQIDALIDRDSGEEFAHGQSVRDTFPLCDLFVRVDVPVTGPSEGRAVGQLVEKLRRFFTLIFHAGIVTPTSDESAMYAAASAARNSACLSRQVGAAATSAKGEILAVGWNDVPQGGGGLYGKPRLVAQNSNGTTLQHVDDKRCFAEAGYCRNDAEKSAIASKVVESLVAAGHISDAARAAAIETVLSDSRVRDLIEFSRAVHAEMHAILTANRVAGDRVLGGRLFVTTYPCHSCARHIVAAGISEVVYIEPYRKSLATRLHSDAITEVFDETDKVRILQFDGVAPRRFIDLFEAGARKAGGKMSLDSREISMPLTRVSLKAIPRLEEVVVADVRSKRLKLQPLVEKEDPNGA